MKKLCTDGGSGIPGMPERPGPITSNLMCFVAMFTWAIAFPIADLLMESWGTVALGTVRMALGVALLFTIWVCLEGLQPVRNAPWRPALVIGGIGFGVGTLLFLTGQKLTNAVTPAIAAAMMPICGALIEVALDKRILHGRLVFGILLALLGGLLAAGVTISETRLGTGLALCVAAVFLFAWATRATSRELTELTMVGKTTATLIGALLVMTVTHLFLYVQGSPATLIGVTDGFHLTLLLVSATLSLALAQFLWIWGAGSLGILIASFHMNAVPFYVMVILVLVMDHHWQWAQAVGGLLVASGVFLAQSRHSVSR